MNPNLTGPDLHQAIYADPEAGQDLAEWCTCSIGHTHEAAEMPPEAATT